jgi:hypothetical protein
MYLGENRDLAANIVYYADESSGERLNAEIVNSDGIVVRNLTTEVSKGFNKMRWRYDMNPVELAGQIDRSQGRPGAAFQERSGGFSGGGFGRSMQVIPGDYTVRINYNGGKSTSSITVRSDPRSPAPDTRAMRENLKRADPIKFRIRDLNEVYQKYFECSHVISKVQDYASKSEDFAESVKEFHPKVKGIYDALERKLSGRSEGLFSKINEYRILYTSSTALTEEQEKSILVAADSIEDAIRQINDFLETEWPVYLKNLASKQISVNAVINQ